MQGYDNSSYGDAFADVYDAWYGDITSVEATVSTLADIAARTTRSDGAAADVVELGVGTGRLALPLAGRIAPATVWGVDSSAAMLARFDANRAAHPSAEVDVRTVLGDMSIDLPLVRVGLVFVAFNTFFGLPTAAAQQRCFAAVAERLLPGGSFVIEAFVPDEPARAGDHVEVRSMSVDNVVLSISRYGTDQTAEGHLVELTDAGGVRLRPWSIRYSTIAELDVMAAAVGLTCTDRWQSFARDTFTDDSDRHVSVYARSGL